MHPFTSSLMLWHHSENLRELPWKGEKSPYRVWLREVILQQTRVEQGQPYYDRFLQTFPTVHDLAAAPHEKVFKLWEGLGYYSRCKNLIASAKYISEELNGVFPSAHENIVLLKGVGAYTAAAIASFSFDLPHAVVDGNVLRVLSRYFGIFTPVNSTEGRKQFSKLAQELLDVNNPAAYNQAIMDFGATVCKPRQPLCSACVLSGGCKARKDDLISVLPVKGKQLEKRKRWLVYLLIRSAGKVAVRKRLAGDVWENLHEFYLKEFVSQPSDDEIKSWVSECFKEWNQPMAKMTGISSELTQQLSHQTISTRFAKVELPSGYGPLEGYNMILEEEVPQYAFPRVINRYLESIQNETS